MDCAKCDPLLIDELYGELDEVTSAAVRRHVEACAQCSEAWQKISRGKELAGAISEQVPEGLETKILDAVKEAQKVVPIRSRASRALSWAGSWAMRPQTAMAALFLLMIGSSAIYLGRGRSQPASEMSADEGYAIEKDRAASPAAPSPESPAASAMAMANAPSPPPAPPAQFAPAKKAKMDMAEEFEPYAQRESKGSGALGIGGASAGAAPPAQARAAADVETATTSSLREARAVRDQQGCPSAVSRYDAIAAKSPGTQEAATATYEAAKCYETFGDYSAARSRYQRLEGTAYASQAKLALANLDAMVKVQGGAVAGGNASPKRSAPAAPLKAESAKKTPTVSGAME